MRIARAKVMKVAIAIYEADKAVGNPDYDRLAPIMKSQYERMAKATIKAQTTSQGTK